MGGCNINIPYYVSNGYLVFSPDIYIKKAKVGESAANAIISAAKHLAQYKFVDTAKMGLQGCSGGGYETNYIITQTCLFKAACASSSMADFISGYGNLSGNGESLQSMYELGWWRMGGSLWDLPQAYIKNSPVLYANQVTTPLLLFHTIHDDVCPFSQAIEYFTALRRLNKRVWLLEYKDGNHGVWGKSADDFSMRMKQFFDHYLREKPAPEWMK